MLHFSLELLDVLKEHRLCRSEMLDSTRLSFIGLPALARKRDELDTEFTL